MAITTVALAFVPGVNVIVIVVMAAATLGQLAVDYREQLGIDPETAKAIATVSQTAFNAASGFAGGAGFLGAKGWGGAIANATVAAITSPKSPLPDNWKQWISLAQSTQKGVKAYQDASKMMNDGRGTLHKSGNYFRQDKNAFGANYMGKELQGATKATTATANIADKLTHALDGQIVLPENPTILTGTTGAQLEQSLVVAHGSLYYYGPIVLPVVEIVGSRPLFQGLFPNYSVPADGTWTRRR